MEEKGFLLSVECGVSERWTGRLDWKDWEASMKSAACSGYYTDESGGALVTPR